MTQKCESLSHYCGTNKTVVSNFWLLGPGDYYLWWGEGLLYMEFVSEHRCQGRGVLSIWGSDILSIPVIFQL